MPAPSPDAGWGGRGGAVGTLIRELGLNRDSHGMVKSVLDDVSRARRPACLKDPVDVESAYMAHPARLVDRRPAVVLDRQRAVHGRQPH